MNDLRTRIIIEAINNTQKTLDEINKGLGNVGKNTSGLGSLFSVKGAVIASALTGITLGIRKVVKEAAAFEQTKVAFNTLTGSSVESKKHLDDLANFAAETPFTLPGIENASKMLLGFGFNLEEIKPTLKSIGDISSGLGLRQDGMQRLILNLGQIQTQGKLTGRELRDFAVNGVPILDMLANSMGKTKDEISNMTSAGKIMTKDVTNAFKKATDEGGKFGNMMAQQAKTFLGLYSNMQDQISIEARKIGVNLIAPLKVALPVIISLIKPMGSAIRSVIDFVVRLSAVLAVVGKSLVRASAAIVPFINYLKAAYNSGSGFMAGMKVVVDFMSTVFVTAFNIAATAVKGFISVVSKLPIIGDAMTVVGEQVSAQIELMSIDFRILSNGITNAKMEAERDFSDFTNSFKETGGAVGGVADDTAEKIKDMRKQIAEDLNDMNTDYWGMVVDVNKSLRDLNINHGKTMKDLEDQMQDVQDKVADLESDYADKFASIGEKIGSAFVDNQDDIDKLKEKIKDLNKEMASGSNSGEKKIEITADIAEATAELSKLEAVQSKLKDSDFTKQFKAQIDEVERLSKLTDIEQTFEAAKKQQEELLLETQKRKTEFAAEIAQIQEKQAFEKQAYESQRNELIATKMKMQEFQQAVVEAMADMENQTAEKVALMGAHLKDLQNILRDVQSTVYSINTARSGVSVAPAQNNNRATVNTANNTITVNLGGVTIKNAEDEQRMTKAITDALNNITTKNA